MKIRRNILLFKLDNFFGELWPLSALAIVYFEQITGSYAFALGLFSIANIVQSLFEIPTGIISDKMGRRGTMIASSSIFFLSFILLALAGNFSSNLLLIIGGILWGIAKAFYSGTAEALIYETMQQLRKENKYDIIFARSLSFGQIGLATGAFIAAIVTYFYSLHVLAWISVIPVIGQIIVAFLLIEPFIHIKDETSSLKHFITAWKELCKNRKLQILGLFQMFNKGISYSSHCMEGAYFNLLIPTWVVYIARMVKQLSGAVSFAITPYIRKFGFFKILLFSSIGSVFVRLTAVILNNFATPFIFSLCNLFYGSEATAESALLQKELSPKQRATMGSIVSLLGGIMSAAIYLIIGIIADNSSVYFAIILLIICKIILGIGYYLLLKKYRN